MATIKLTGLKNGRQSTAGDGDDAQIDGDLTIGDGSGEDTVVFNAEVDSHFIPDDNDTYDLGSASKKWRLGYFDQVNAKLRHVNTAKYNSTDTSQQYVRWNTAGSNASPGVNNKFVAPSDGLLHSVSIRSTTAANGTNIAFHKASNGSANLNTTASETVGVDISAANTTYQALFSTSGFNAGDILGISVNPSSIPNDVDITVVWIFDWNA